jgi:5-methylthioadenosine/S-adenosylhomocysteine deaminase
MRRMVIEGGTVISMDPVVGDLRRGDVLIEDGAIVEVAPRIDAGDCEALDARDMIVMPGLVDSHRHLWYSAIRGTGMDATLGDMAAVYWPQLAAHYTPEDLYAATRAGVADALEHGVTTVLDWCHVINTPEHGPEAVRALRELPMRAVFAYGASMTRKLDELAGQTAHSDSWDPARRVRDRELPSADALVTMALALQGPEFTTLDIARADVAVARELGVPMTMHCGIPVGQPPKRTIERLAQTGELGPDMQFVHCCATGDDEFRMLAEAGGVAVACPMAELAMGMGEPPVGRMREAGLRSAVGCDAVCTASGDLFDEARTALFSERARQTRRRVAAGGAIDDASQLGLTAREALEAITINAAHACWLGDRVGSLTPGKRADVILLRADDLNLSPLSDAVGMLVSSAHAGNVDTVIVDGRVVRRGGAFVDLDVASIQASLVACRDRLYAAGGFEGMAPAA